MEWTVKLDKRGRITLPKSLRDTFALQANDDFDFTHRAEKLTMFRKSDGLAFILKSAKQSAVK
jgi:AbrB family looped-hinge helix DNA binding protein